MENFTGLSFIRNEKTEQPWIDYKRLRLPVRLGDAESDHVPIEDEAAIAAFFHTNGIVAWPIARVPPTQRSDTAAEQPAEPAKSPTQTLNAIRQDD